MLFEIRQAIRGTRRNPGFALICVVTLALGIGISTAVFSVVNGLLLQPLRFPQPERIVALNTKNSNRDYATPRMTGGDFVDIRQSNRVFDAISVYFGGEIGVQLRDRAEFTGIYFVNPEFFRIFGQHEYSGAVVSAGFAMRHFGDAARAVGSRIQVENKLYEVAGVLNGPRYPADAEIWLPAPWVPENLNRTAYNYRAVARLKPGVSVEQAQANLKTVGAQLAAAYPKSNRGKTFIAMPLRDQLVAPVRNTLYFLLGAVLLVLLIACANVSNLLLARATVRTREIAVRAAIGATRARIVRQLVLESGVFGVLGGLLGIALAWWGTRVLVYLAPSNLPRVQDIHVDYAVLAFAMALSMISALLFGVMPALQASRVDLAEAVKQGASRGVLGGGSHRLRNGLVVAEIALSFVLATGAGLFFRSFLALNAVDLGFKPDRMLVMYAHAPAEGLAEHVGVGRMFVDRLLPRLANIPGVESAAAVMGLPAGVYGSNGSYAVVGRQTMAEGQKLPEANFSLSSPNYFATLRVPLVRGRDFTVRDRHDAPGVAIVSESLARQTFPGENPVGRQIVCGLDSASMAPMTVVGVVGDVRQDSPGAPPRPTLYMPLEQHPYHANELQVVVRTAGAPAALTRAVRAAAHDLAPDMAVKFTTLDDMLSESIAAPRFRTFLVGTFAILALLLATAGIYGVMSYIVTQRTSELGLRMALGASAGDVMRIVLSRATGLAAIGLVVGAALSLAFSRAIGSMLFGLTATDPSTWAMVLVAVGGVAVMAAAVPAWRASRIDPMIALREE